jgi:hypothetical protein
MSTFKKAQVLLLETNKSDIILSDKNQLVWMNVPLAYYEGIPLFPHHLYIVNDDIIKINDWYIDNNKTLAYCEDIRDNILNGPESTVVAKDKIGFNRFSHQGYDCFKIIATTDKSLELPTVSDYFIAYYIEAYNRAKPITDILVEYENDILKIHSNNSIFAKNPKDSWSREEIEVLLFKYAEENALTSTKSEIDDFNQWIENNL